MQLSAWLKAEASKPRKQRRNLKQLHLDLKELGYEGSYDRVAAFARQWKVGQSEWGNSASKRTYSSFYAAHAMLRLAGSAVTMLSSATAAKLNKVGGQYLGISPQFVTGLYHVQLVPGNSSQVQLIKIGDGSGGSHEEMWRLFNELVQYVENQLLTTQAMSAQARAAVKVLIELRAHLFQHRKSSGSWLSTVRNNLKWQIRLTVRTGLSYFESRGVAKFQFVRCR